MNFSRFLDIQSWWEVPSIAYFCSLFRTAFNLLDFDIEELEEALLTDGTEDSGSSLLTELIVRLLNGCLGNNDISAFNYQMYLRRLFRQKCQESGRYNPFNTDIDFQFLPLRRKVEILYALCDFRLDAEDVFDLFKNLEAESLRVEPLGWDDNDSAYWYFYGTRLYREDIIRKPKGKKKKKNKDKKRGWLHGEDWNNDETERVWQVVCFTEEDWTHLTQKFSKATSKIEKELFRSLSQNFMPEIPRLFLEKERLQRKRLLELAPRRTSSRVLQKIRQKEEEESSKATTDVETSKDSDSKEQDLARRNRAKRRNLIRSKSESSSLSDSSENSEPEEMPQKATKSSKNEGKKSKNSSATHKGEPPPEPPIRTGRKTNNSLASATGQIVIPDNVEPVNSTRKKLKTSQIFSQTDEDIQIDMYKVLEQLTNHEDAWPFLDAVEEEYAPNYYTVIRRPMDLHKMEERLDGGYYTEFSTFKADFKLIVNNCRLYNGQDNEYTAMVDNLQAAFDRLTEKYMYRVSSSDEEIAVEYQLPTPSRRQKRKASQSPTRQAPDKRTKRKSQSEDAEPKSSTSDIKEEVKPDDEDNKLSENGKNDCDRKKNGKGTDDDAQSIAEKETKVSKESHKDKGKKKRHHHRHGKHSKNHKKKQHGSKSKHSKKQKHAKNKDKEGKKSKQKKKKSKHQDPKPVPEKVKRSESRESLSSSNRSRSASPLPSIHTPSPSPTELDKSEKSSEEFDKIDYDQPATSKHHAECEFLKDKYDKIKERRRHAARDAWESLFDYKHKTDKHKHNLNIPEKDKNQKLRETIEKLKAKNEKYKDTSLFTSLFTPRSTRRVERKRDYKEDSDEESDCSDDEPLESVKGKCTNKKLVKKSSAKNESASEALEEAVKDISKWLDEAPKSSAISSLCDSPAPTISTEDQDNSSRQDDELSQGEKSVSSKKDTTRKRPSSREPKLVKRREIQRIIDRLQPGKSKGNLLTNLPLKSSDKVEDTSTTGQVDSGDSSKTEEPSPKLSLGSVLPTVDFTLGEDRNFGNEDVSLVTKVKTATKATETEGDTNALDVSIVKEPDEVVVATEEDVKVETEPIMIKPNQEKVTPNLSAWFKAFGAPKTPAPVSTTKRKAEDTENEEKPPETASTEIKANPKIATNKFDSPNDPNSPNHDGGDSPHPNMSATQRQRRMSTGSSISERSSFSQDLDSPRHQMSHTSPQLRSPASPRNDDFQKITYPIINGTVRAGFYQDTTSLKSSPDKSCSPREGPQSPYSSYPQHVYASSSTAPGSATPNYFVDHNKSPLSTYNHNAPPYYDSNKTPAVNKTPRNIEEYANVTPEMYPPNHFTSPYSPSPSQYSPVQTNYSQPQISPQPMAAHCRMNQIPQMQEPKSSLFPVKKRTYNEPEQPTDTSQIKEQTPPEIPKNDYSKLHQSNMPISTPSVDNIALALNEKSQLSRYNNTTKDDRVSEYCDRFQYDNSKTTFYENNEPAHAHKRETNNIDPTKSLGMTKKDGVDMVNMGYFNSEDRRNSTDTRDVEYMGRESKATIAQAHRGYEIEAIAINLGITSQQLPKPLTKPSITSYKMTPAHSHERSHTDMSMNQTIAHAHQNQYDSLTSGQPISNFSLNDIELANKKLYSNNIPSTPLDYGNWRNSNQMRKPDILPSDYSSAYINNEEKTKMDTSAALNYKNLQHQQYNNYAAMPRINTQRAQELPQNTPSELRIPNPRGMLKSDNTTVTSITDDAIAKNIEALSKAQKSEKLVQNHPLVSSIPYKTPYSSHSTLLDPIEPLRNLQIPQMLERYSNDERYLSSFASSTSSLYHDKTFQMAQMFNKGLGTDVNTTVSHSNIYSQPSMSMSKDNNTYKNTTTMANSHVDTKAKTKRKRTAETKQTIQTIPAQAYHPASSCSNDVLTSVKTNIMPSTAFNFGSTNMALGGMYADNAGFSIDDFRNSTSQLMAANYMAAAVAHQRNNEANAEKLAKPAHQSSNHSASSFPFIAHSQVRAGYPFMSAEASSPLYQQYIQRYQEELQRQTGAQIMGLYPPTYPPTLGVRQPYDSINRPSWI